MFDHYFLYFSIWVGGRVIHIFKAYLILNPMVIKSFFYVAYEAHNSSLKKNTPYLESNICCAFTCIELLPARQQCSVCCDATRRWANVDNDVSKDEFIRQHNSTQIPYWYYVIGLFNTFTFKSNFIMVKLSHNKSSMQVKPQQILLSKLGVFFFNELLCAS